MMAKDKKDRHTIGDLVPKKIGRPTVYTDWGPMTDQERQERHRAGRKSVQILMTEAQLGKLKRYCKKHGIDRHKLVCGMIKSLRMGVPPGI